MYKIGNSVDIHRLVKNKPLYIGGIEIPSDRGSLAHSDGDALLHSLAEALLGALGQGDLGDNYPNTDNKYKNIRSTYFIEDAKKRLDKEGYKISNIDIMIVLEKPNLSTYKESVKDNISKLLNIDKKIINLKAGSNEKIGKIGNNKAYLCWCSVIIEKEK